MLKRKLNWRRPLFYLLLPVFLIMVFLGFPLPVAPPPAIKPAQEISTTVKKKKKRHGALDPLASGDPGGKAGRDA